MRRFLTTMVAIITRVFFRRIEIAGAEHLVRSGGVIFAVNHPNALVDPIFLICFAPRPVSFLAKAPLFRYPLIGTFVRALDCIPVYRKHDPGVDTSRNAETFEKVRQILTSGGAIAIFPEGTTHSDSKLKSLKTGAARMALIAATTQPVTVIPTGIYYSAKKAFRSSVLMSFGEPTVVQQSVLDAEGEPPAERVAALTRKIEESLNELTLQADSRAALSLVGRAERIFRSEGASGATLAAELELRRQLVAGYAVARERLPGEVAMVEAHIAQFESELRERGLTFEDLNRNHRVGLRMHWTWPFVWFLLLPLAIAGAVIHWPLYRLIGFLSRKFSRGEEELVATMKMIGGLVFFPLLWIVLTLLATRWLPLRWALSLLIVLPLTARAALMFSEQFDRLVGRLRAVGGALQGRSMDTLLARRRAIRQEIIAIAEAMQRASNEAAPTMWPPVGNDLLG
jgi:glycerol-3-phosphate O-acyltransferase/dihydroxyacetone phosphate acyltransferase